MSPPRDTSPQTNGSIILNNRSHLQSFDPTVQTFHPTSLPALTTSSVHTTTATVHDITHPTMGYSVDLSEMEYDLRKTRFELSQMKNAVGNDLRIIYNEVRKARMERQPVHIMENTVAGAYLPGGSFAPSEVMRNNFTDEQLAAAWLEDAETSEGIAQRLRNQAFAYCPEWKTNGVKQIEGKAMQNPTGGQGMAAEFVCCKEEFPNVKSLLEHLKGMHTQSQLAIASEPSSLKKVSVKPDVADMGEAELEYPTDSSMLASPAWTPHAVRKMPTTSFPVPASTTTLSAEMLHSHFHGEQYSPGFWFVKSASILPSKSYWLLSHEFEPFLPATPGKHGTKLTPFFNDTLSGAGDAPGEEHYQKVPVFIQSADSNNPGFRYFGEYSQTRYSDRLDYDTLMTKVPDSVRRYWAKVLTEPDRPAWVTQKIVEQFWPKPVYEGPVSSVTETNDTARDGRVSRALEDYGEVLAEWKRESDMRISHINEQSVFDAFAEPDSALEPGLRLWWEYMECVGWDDKFYDMLVQLKEREENGFLDASGKKLTRKTPVMTGDVFVQRKPKVVKKTSPPKTSEYPLTHADGSAAYTWVKKRRIALPQQAKASKPAVKKEEISADEKKLKDTNPLRFKDTTAINGDQPANQVDGKEVNPFEGDLEAAKQFNRELAEPKQWRNTKSVPPHMMSR